MTLVMNPRVDVVLGTAGSGRFPTMNAYGRPVPPPRRLTTPGSSHAPGQSPRPAPKPAPATEAVGEKIGLKMLGGLSDAELRKLARDGSTARIRQDAKLFLAVRANPAKYPDPRRPASSARPQPAAAAPPPSVPADPKAQAGEEWDENSDVRKGFTSRGNYVAWRAMELRGQAKVSTGGGVVTLDSYKDWKERQAAPAK